ncbi:MAG TPA: S53 family peptidase [Gaiellaceae bacterium]|nr:S53 family peptidase [Gaiellaceae bacterium]
MRKHLWAAFAAVSLLLLVPSAFADPGNGRSALNGSVPPWATSANFKGATPSGDSVGFRVYLGLRNADQAEALAKAVSDPSSSSFHKFLTPGQFNNTFSPTQAQVGNVRSWLQSQGFTIDYTPTNNHYVAAEGTAAQVESAFGVKLNQYSVNGLTLRAPSTSLTVPASVASEVVGVLGIDQSMALAQPLDRVDTNAPPSAGFRNAPPCSQWWAQNLASNVPQYHGQTLPYAPCGYTPPQLREAYGADHAGANGTGTTVAIIDAYASPTIFQDASTYASRNDPANPLSPSQFSQMIAPGTLRRPENSQQDPQGWYGEETLDVEAVHAMAPGAKIVFVGAPNNYRDLDAALNHVVDRRLADIVTNSYGFPTELLPTGYIKPVNDTLIQAALEGMTVMYSSGDNGDEVGIIGYRTADWPASSPWVTSVGGTSLAAGVSAADPGKYLFETGWSSTRNRLNCSGALGTSNSWCQNEVYLYGAGGGASRLFPEPSWQLGVVPSNIALPSGTWNPPFVRAGRAVPDISAVGDPNTGMLIGQTQSFSTGVAYGEYRIGGTSLSSPLMAGMFALAQQLNGGNALGFVNPLLYTDSGIRAALTDVTPQTAAGVVRVDFANSENAAGGLLYSVRTLGYVSSPENVAAPAGQSDYNASIFTRPGYDDVTGLGSPTAGFYQALANAVH